MALALLPLLASSYNTNQLVILTPEELKPMILRVSHPESSCFTSEMQAAMPHALNPKATEKAELILEKLVRVSCGKHKCARPQPIWWIEEHVKVVQLLAKMRKSSACPLFCFIAGNPGHMSTGRYIVAGRVWWSGAVWCCPMQRSYRARRAAAASGSSSSSPRSGRCCRRRRRARTAASRTSGSWWTTWPSARRATSTHSSCSTRSSSTATGAAFLRTQLALACLTRHTAASASLQAYSKMLSALWKCWAHSGTSHTDGPVCWCVSLVAPAGPLSSAKPH